MDTITSKGDIKQSVAMSVSNTDIDALAQVLYKELLTKKVRFPLLEFAAKEIYSKIPVKNQIPFTDKVVELKTIGGNVLAGIILQLRLEEHFAESLTKAIAYIIAGDEWYVCDIIGERVQGHALLTMPEKTVPELKKMSAHHDKWIVRSVGVATHYAVKKGLKKKYVDEMFRLLLSLSNTTEFHTKKGVGWAVKTIAKFHPEIIERYDTELELDNVKQWFKTKIKIGLGRTDKYAGRYTG